MRKIYNNMVFLPHPTKMDISTGFQTWINWHRHFIMYLKSNLIIIHPYEKYTQVKTARRFDASLDISFKMTQKLILFVLDGTIIRFLFQSWQDEDIELSEKDIDSQHVTGCVRSYSFTVHIWRRNHNHTRVRCKDSTVYTLKPRFVDELGDKVPYNEVNDEWFDIVFKGTVLGVTILVSSMLDMMVLLILWARKDRVGWCYQRSIR